MADDNIFIDVDVDEFEDSDCENVSSDNSRSNKHDTRKRLEEYLEEKKLRELIDY